MSLYFGSTYSPLARMVSSQGRAPAEGPVGFQVFLLLVYLVMEYGRPSNPLKIPMMISVLLFFWWCFKPNKIWNAQIVCFLLFLGVMAFDIIIAENWFDAFWTTYLMTIFLVCICIPLVHCFDTLKKIRAFIFTFIGVNVYVGLWAITHSGYGPAGAAGGQDENYVAMYMDMMLPFCFFLAVMETSVMKKALFVGAGLVAVGAAVVGLSRGGFLGMAGVMTYCIMKSPKRWMGIVVASIVIAGILFFAGQKYWAEVETIGDTSEGTADMRIEMWKTAYRMFLDYPLTGVGPMNFLWRVGEYQSEEQYKKYGRDLSGSIITHSLYFDILSETGMAGVILVSIVLFRTYMDLRAVEAKSRTFWAESKELLDTGELQEARTYARAISASLIGFLICSAFLSTLYMAHLWILCSLAMALRMIQVDQPVGASTPSKVGMGVARRN